MKKTALSKLWKLALVLALALMAQLAPPIQSEAKAWPQCPGGPCRYVKDPVTGCCSSPLECFDFCP